MTNDEIRRLAQPPEVTKKGRTKSGVGMKKLRAAARESGIRALRVHREVAKAVRRRKKGGQP